MLFLRIAAEVFGWAGLLLVLVMLATFPLLAADPYLYSTSWAGVAFLGFAILSIPGILIGALARRRRLQVASALVGLVYIVVGLINLVPAKFVNGREPEWGSILFDLAPGIICLLLGIPILRVSPKFLRQMKEAKNWYIAVLKKYAVFSGRARRKEYWMFVLVNFIIGFVLDFIEALFMPGSSRMSLPGVGSIGAPWIIYSLYNLAVLLPSIGVAIRRLHDTNRSGWWLLIELVPLVGAIGLIVWTVRDSQPGDNKYGANPKTGNASVLVLPGA